LVVGGAESVGRSVVGGRVVVAVLDGVGGAAGSEVGGGVLGLLDADGEADGDCVGDSDFDGDGSSVVASGTLARMSSGAAVSRDGVSYENSPLANPAAATTTAVAPAPTSAKRRRRLVVPPRSSESSGMPGRGSRDCASKRWVPALGECGRGIARGSWTVRKGSAGGSGVSVVGGVPGAACSLKD
jgi:hypothetical protein